MGTHYSAGSTVYLTYWSSGQIAVDGTATVEDRWTASDYWNSNTLPSELYYYNTRVAKKAIAANKVIVGDETGYEQVDAGVTFDLTCPILFTTAAIKLNATNYTNLRQMAYDKDLSSIKANFTSLKNRAIYLVVTLAGRFATIADEIAVDSANLPSAENGKYYILLGHMGNNSTGADKFILNIHHPIYQYTHGAFREYVGDGVNYLPLGGGTLTGTLGLEPASGAGGKVELRASTANTTQTGIVLDQYQSNLRIYGIASADGTTQTGVGRPLVINPYDHTITGEYDFDGRIYSDVIASTGGVDYPVGVLSSNYTAGYKNVDFNTSFRYMYRDGIDSQNLGYAVLTLGNNTQSSSSGGTRGRLRLYGNGTKRTDLYPAADNNSAADYDVYLPPVNGELLSVNGTQTITGMKHINARQYFIQGTVTKGTAPQAHAYREFICLDQSEDEVYANGKRTGSMGFVTTTDNINKVTMVAYKPVSGSNDQAAIAVCYGPSGAYTEAITPAVTDNSTKIATTAYVRGILKSGTAAPTTTTCPNGCFYFRYS